MTHTIDMIDFILTAAAVWIVFCVIRYMLLKKNGSTDMKKLLHLTTAYFYFVILISIMLLPVVLSAPYRGMFFTVVYHDDIGIGIFGQRFYI